MSFTVFVGHAYNEIDKLWQQIYLVSKFIVAITGRNLADWQRGPVHHHPDRWTLA